MKLDASEVLEGYFWRPGDTETLSGRLRISEVGKGELELLGAFDGPLGTFTPESANVAMIHGLIEGGEVTLYNCFYIKRSLGIGTVSRSKLRVGAVFRGAHLPAKADVRFSELDLAISGLGDWLQIRGITSRLEFDAASNTLKSVNVSYIPPPVIHVVVPGLRIGFEFRCTAPFGGQSTGAAITQQVRMTIAPDVPLPFEALLAQAGRLVNFLSFAADEVLSIDAIEALSPTATIDLDVGTKSLPLKVFFETSTETTTVDLQRHTMLFAYPDVADQLAQMMTVWLERHEVLAPAFNLYFAVRSGRHSYLESAFLSIAQALETLHDRTTHATLESPEEFAKRVERILAGCPEEFQEWLAAELAYANKPTLRNRLKAMLKPFAGHFGNADARKKFVDRAVDTRNYLTHYDPRLAERAAHGVEIYYLTAKLEALFQLQLLSMVGVTDAQIAALVTSNQKLRHRLGMVGS
ncbi:hypothetical protein K6W76_30310 [Burkholderia anthina]|uniref:ApeA N-terminal domain 1-containing protein n=1 Tax=Burkholderia anthina TaxID=179879 RepID=UPI00158B8181|nr:HEPN domain-containing protein [Burkholderia anthina]MBY4870741.1 hypothetical protein [Burkholderia anthina]